MMMIQLILFFGISVGCLFSSRILLHFFQLESYQFPGYFRTVRRNILKAFMPGFVMTILGMIILLLMFRIIQAERFPLLCALTGALLYIAGGFATGYVFSEKKAKKPFVYTARVKRLCVISTLVLFLILSCVCAALYTFLGKNSVTRGFVILFPLFLPLWIAICGLLAWPIEKGISELYFRDAQNILKQRKDLIKIGITGSWGKTSVKFILGTLLEEKYHTLVTPASYNTPMGVTKIIRSRLEPGHRVFVAEMGARHVGDIREMCRLVHPQIGIITSVGPQHLDTFRTVERVARTKYELIDALPNDGEAFFADDEGICRDLYYKTSKSRHLSGLDRNIDDLWAEEISYTPEGSSFILCHGNDRVSCSTDLLGEINIRNILVCVSVALYLGLSMDQIKRGIRKIKPVEHRLQLIHHPGGLNVIDDAFNSNIKGARQAFHVLSSFPSKRIVVTPGMVELGDKEFEMNHEFGAAMADCCDIIILVGKKRCESIISGLREKAFPENKIHLVSSLDEATSLLKELAEPGDTVLFENDLPDNYTES